MHLDKFMAIRINIGVLPSMEEVKVDSFYR